MLTGKAMVAGLMGWPVSHSRSPRLHGFWIDKHRLDAAYIPMAVRPEDFSAALRALPKLGFRGCNLTLPHKEAALALLDRIDPAARRIGAVNTVVVAEDGTLEGRNTDVIGFVENLRAAAPRFDCRAGPALVLGAGGGARAVIAGLIDQGAPAVHVINRDLARAERLARELGPAVRPAGWDRVPALLAEAHILVNTTSLGMTGAPPLAIDLAPLKPGAVVNDIVYTPLETPLLAAAHERQHVAVDGLGMLLHQGVAGFEAWFGVRPEVTEELRRWVLG
ncbi:shikimate dehydrogenase [Desertibaculum subflavum]|uniref:shikimate dehydrogenase n=1 Tax=Desertibaculum subflavum TaxID=2268458 RepID=UPI0013C404A8